MIWTTLIAAVCAVRSSAALSLGSKNGTFSDGQRIAATPVRLHDGSQVAFGTLLAIYRESGSVMPTQTHCGLESAR
jgi:pSer/pThr/pTyr-binding forkhead associated (FHA) protein